MLRVDYQRNETAVDKKMKGLLEPRGFDFKLAKSEAYCRDFFSRLSDEDKKVLVGLLTEFVQQPFVRAKSATPELLGRALYSGNVYLYWGNSN